MGFKAEFIRSDPFSSGGEYAPASVCANVPLAPLTVKACEVCFCPATRPTHVEDNAKSMERQVTASQRVPDQTAIQDCVRFAARSQHPQRCRLYVAAGAVRVRQSHQGVAEISPRQSIWFVRDGQKDQSRQHGISTVRREFGEIGQAVK